MENGTGGGGDKGGDGDEVDSSEYSPKAIRRCEGAYRLLAVFTPKHTFGSVTYVFPRRGICCSGYALPLESNVGDVFDNDDDKDEDSLFAAVRMSQPPRGPRLDFQGYLATSASRPQQMSSAMSLIDDYIDRFWVVLPARGDAVFLDHETITRKKELMESMGLYKKIGEIYSWLGIVE